MQVQYTLVLSDCHETRISLTDFRKILIHQIHGKPSTVSRVVPCGQIDRQTWWSK